MKTVVWSLSIALAIAPSIGCTPEVPTGPIGDTPPPSTRGWGFDAPTFTALAPGACAFDQGAPLLDDALIAATFSRSELSITSEALQASGYARAGVLDDALRLPWFVDVRSQPGRLGCTADAITSSITNALAVEHPTASLLRYAAALVDRADANGTLPIQESDSSFSAALSALGAGAADGKLDDDLEQALVPVLLAIKNGLDARAALGANDDADGWRDYGGDLMLLNDGQNVPDATDPAVLSVLIGEDRRALYVAAAQIAFAIEDTDWQQFSGRAAQFRVETPAGAIVASGADDDTHDEGGDILLLIDLGGSDTYLGQVASNTSGANAVSVAIDIDGADRYGYPGSDGPRDFQGLLPIDDEGRNRGGPYGRVSMSRASRQAAARNGIALLFDLGGDDDSYASLRASQGYAHLGAAALVDDGGNDTYDAEVLSQGAAQMGVALLIDRGAGNDVRRSFSESQGFGFALGAGLLIDEGGDDDTLCDVGDPALGGVPLYYSPQLPGTGNTSMCQGAGLGLRDDAIAVYLSGGIGVLVDVAGDDRYTSSLFAQGAGYWQGVGVLSDLDGSDAYDAFWYAQGAAAHYAVGALVDAGYGDDVFGANVPQVNVTMGAGHDFSAGFFSNAGGNDRYVAAQLAIGAGNCNGIGVFVDDAGDDTYTTPSTLTGGVGNTSAECLPERPDTLTAGVMIDGGGDDTYTLPGALPAAANSSTWSTPGGNLAAERGVGVDGEGPTGM